MPAVSESGCVHVCVWAACICEQVCTCVCLWVCACVWEHVYMCTRAGVCMCVSRCVRAGVCMCIWMGVCMCVQVGVNVWACVQAGCVWEGTCACNRVCVCERVHVCAHTCTPCASAPLEGELGRKGVPTQPDRVGLLDVVCGGSRDLFCSLLRARLHPSASPREAWCWKRFQQQTRCLAQSRPCHCRSGTFWVFEWNGGVTIPNWGREKVWLVVWSIMSFVALTTPIT